MAVASSQDFRRSRPARAFQQMKPTCRPGDRHVCPTRSTRTRRHLCYNDTFPAGSHRFNRETAAILDPGAGGGIGCRLHVCDDGVLSSPRSHAIVVADPRELKKERTLSRPMRRAAVASNGPGASSPSDCWDRHQLQPRPHKITRCESHGTWCCSAAGNPRHVSRHSQIVGRGRATSEGLALPTLSNDVSGARKQLAREPGSQSAKRGFGRAFHERGDPQPHAQSRLRRVFLHSLEFACLRSRAASWFLPPLKTDKVVPAIVAWAAFLTCVISARNRRRVERRLQPRRRRIAAAKR